MNVQIEPHPPVKGRRQVVVDGAPWAVVNMESHGRRGASFHFQQVGMHGRISRDVHEPGERYRKLRPVTIRSDGEPHTLNDRLAAEARSLIAEGLLRDPADVERERAEREAKREAEHQRERAAIRAADLEVAHALIAEHAPGLNDRDALAAAMADQFSRERGKP